MTTSARPVRPERPTGSAIALDLALAAVFGLLAVTVGATSSRPEVVAVLLAVALAVRRLAWPIASALAVAAALVQIAGQFNPVANLAYPFLFWALGAHRNRRVRWFGLAAAAIAVLVATAWFFGTTGFTAQQLVAGAIFATATLAATGGAWLLGYLRWQRQEQVAAEIEARLAEAEQRRLNELLQQNIERSRIAADMHDVVAHSWAVVAAQADGARYALHSTPEQAEAALLVIAETARSAMGDVRRLLAQLRAAEPGEVTLDFEQRGQLIDRMRASGMRIEATSHGTPQGGLLGVTAHRILGEALTNALKHGDLSQPVEVAEDWRLGYRLRVSNTPRADAPTGHGQGQGKGYGLLGMAERAAVAGGTVSAGREGDRWVVRADLGVGGEPR